MNRSSFCIPGKSLSGVVLPEVFSYIGWQEYRVCRCMFREADPGNVTHVNNKTIAVDTKNAGGRSLGKKWEFYLKPHIGANDIQFGMHRDRVREILGTPFHTREKAFFEIEDIRIREAAKDGYFENELQISYDDNHRVAFMEFSGKDARHIAVYLDKTAVFKTPARQLLDEITEVTKTTYDKSDDEIPYSYVFREIDLCAWRQVIPTDEEAGKIAEDDEGKYFWTIGIGAKGYFTEEEEEMGE